MTNTEENDHTNQDGIVGHPKGRDTSAGQKRSGISDLAPVAATMIVVVASAFYTMGLLTDTVFEQAFGIEGFSQRDTYSLMVSGAPLAVLTLGMTFLSILITATFAYRYVHRKYQRLGYSGPKPSPSRIFDDLGFGEGLYLIFAWLSLLFLAGAAIGYLQSYLTTYEVENGCSGCRHYAAGGKDVVGRPIASDHERVAVLLPTGSVALLRWQDIGTVRPFGEGKRKPPT